MRLLSLLLLPLAAFAGESIQFGPNLIYTSTPVPNTPTNRLEFYIHNWTPTAPTHILNSGATGWLAYTIPFSPTNVYLLIYNTWESTPQIAQFQIGTLPQQAVYVRAQHDPVHKLDMIEAWDINGNRISSNSFSFPSETDTGTSFQIGYGNEPLMSMAFIRVHSTLLPMNSQPPVTVNNLNRVLEWKFDGSLSDSSGNGHTAIYNGGTPVYVPTPYQNTISVIQTSNANSWASVLTQRAGYPATLNGTASYSQADSSASVTCFWQQLSGPSMAQLSGRTTCTPQIQGLVFGDYLYQLTVTAANGSTATATADIGAVAMDNKGIVVNADPNVDALFGNMIAFGGNPWGFADYWAQHAMTLRAADYVSQGWDALQWEQLGSGTTSYYWNGVGWYPGNNTLGTTLPSAITATATTLTVANASKLDLSELPTRILMLPGNYASNSEEIRICSATGNTLNVCYDGRGQNAQSWSSGALVAQVKVSGTGTHFVSDSVAPVCPAGAPGPTGLAAFSAGSVTMTAGSATMLGSGTNWLATTSAFISTAGYYVRVSATHGGTPFQFIAVNQTGGAIAGASVAGGAITAVGTLYGQSGQNFIAGQVNVVITDPTGAAAVVIANVTGGAITSYTVMNGGANYTSPTVTIQPTAITLNRPYPTTADSGTFAAYQILPGSRTLVLRGHHAADPSGTGESMWNATGCESETSVYLNPTTYGNEYSAGHDVLLLDGTLQSGYRYSVTDSTGWVNESGTGGLDFYGESLGSRALYYRSGLTSALNAANAIDDNLVKSPWGNRDVAGYPTLFLGGPAIGAFASAILTGRVQWPDLRAYAAYSEFLINAVYNNGAPNCEYDDTRDTGYAYAWMILSALYDPDTSAGGFRSRWRTDLANMKANDTACKRTDSSWSNGFLWNTTLGPVTLTANSTSVTGTGLSASNCTGITAGTASVTSGSATITVPAASVPASGANTLVITGTMAGSPFTGSYLFSGSGALATLSVLWPGDTGNVAWMAVNIPNLSTNSGAMTAFATGNSDYADLANNYACIWNSATSLTLDHPWKGATGSTYYGYPNNLAGFGQQPFMLGIKSYGMGLLAAAADPALSTYAGTYATFNTQATQWIHDKGVDLNTLTTNYGRVFEFCEPATTASSPAFDQRTPGCNYGTSLNGESTGREQNQEIGNAIANFYVNNPGTANQSWGDSLYGAVWGNSAYNTGGVYSDAASDATNINATNMLDSYIHAGKWYGFFAGMGMLHRWPAVRLGGVTAPDYKTIDIPFTLTGRPNAAQIRVTITQPSGALVTAVCAASPCAVTVDARSGSVLMELDYLNSSGVVIAPGAALPFYVTQ
jgi:hypothetical protein